MNYCDHVKDKSIRKCQFYVRYMESRRRSGINICDEFEWDSKSGNTDEICRRINIELDDYFWGNERNIEGFVRKMEAACNDEILSMAEFDWFKNQGNRMNAHLLFD